jgi:hypothetical protein
MDISGYFRKLPCGSRKFDPTFRPDSRDEAESKHHLMMMLAILHLLGTFVAGLLLGSTMSRTIVYMDALNLFYRALKGTAHKWLDYYWDYPFDAGISAGSVSILVSEHFAGLSPANLKRRPKCIHGRL